MLCGDCGEPSIVLGGSQCCDQTGGMSLVRRCVVGAGRQDRIYRLPGGELPDHVYSGDRPALLEAIDLGTIASVTTKLTRAPRASGSPQICSPTALQRPLASLSASSGQRDAKTGQ
jgi:hypothetical protein